MIYYAMWVEGKMINNPKTCLLTITKGNGFSKLKSFLKHGHFACDLLAKEPTLDPYVNILFHMYILL